MKIVRIRPQFANPMTKTQTVLGLCYLAFHAVGFPLLYGLLGDRLPAGMDELTVNMVYYGLGLAFCFTVMFRYLRAAYDTLLDNFRLCLISVLLGFLIDYAFSTVSTLVLLLLEGAVENPNNDAVMSLASQGEGTMLAIGIFLAPIVEETLFRGAVFGAVRKKSRGWAYVASVGLFALYHVWQYALAAGDPTLLLYVVQYIPVTVALTWIYERSGCIWASVFFHMGVNAVSFYVLRLMESLPM